MPNIQTKTNNHETKQKNMIDNQETLQQMEGDPQTNKQKL